MKNMFKELYGKTPTLSFSVQLALVLILIHAGISWVLYLNHALIPDELLFLEDAGRKFHQLGGRLNPFEFENAFGYGALYSIIHFCFHYFSDPQLTARFFYWLLLVVSNLLLLAVIAKRNQQHAGMAILLLLTFPMAWWQGKITGPEPLAHFFVVASIFSAVWLEGHHKKLFISGIFIGLAIGIKLTTLPVVFVLAVILWDYLGADLKRNKLVDNLKLAAIFLLASFVGYVLANPFVVHDISPIFSQYYLPKAAASHSFREMIWGQESAFWEATPQGSLTFFAIPLSLIGIVCLAGLLRQGSRLLTIAWLASVLAIVVLGLQTPNFFGWYFYSPILLLPLLLSSPLPIHTGGVELAWSKFIGFALLGVVTMSAIVNFRPIISMVNHKLTHMHQLEIKQSISAYADSLITLYEPDQVIDFSEFNLFSLDSNSLRLGNVEGVGVDEARKYQGFDWLWAFAIQKWVPLDANGNLFGCKKLEGRNKVLVMVGERLVSNRDIWKVSFKDWLQSNIEGACPGWRLSFYNVHERINYFLLENYSSLNFDRTLNMDPSFRGSRIWGGVVPNTSGGGVVVGPGADNKNVLSQRIPILPLQQVKIVARAASVVKPTASGRLQINWVGPKDQFISSSGQTILVSYEEHAFSTFAIAPPGAVAGYLYVSPHAPEDVVRYTEMRLLSTSQNTKEK